MNRPIPMLACAAAVLAAGCSSYAPTAVRPGQSADDVARSMGPPTARHALPGGRSRLEYARGPYGKHTWMIDLDADGRVATVSQVLTEANFAAVQPGSARDDVLARLGTPSERRGARGGVELWAYRYDATFCQWFVVTMTGEGRVRDAGYVPDPMCDADDDRGTSN